MTVLLEAEIDLGLVLHLSPAQLEHLGAQSTCLHPGSTSVRGEHYFVCTGVDEVAHTSEWLPLFSRDGLLRLPIMRSFKRGHPKFVRGDTFATILEYWRTPNRAIIECAKWTDPTTAAARNRISVECVEVLVEGLELNIAARRAS